MTDHNVTNESGDVDVCSQCRNVNWAEIATGQPREEPVMTLTATHDELSKSKCRICRMIGTIKPVSLDGEPCSLQTYSAKAMLSYMRSDQPNLRDSILLGINAQRESPFIGLTHANLESDFGVRQILAATVDFDYLRQCWQYCREDHEFVCTATTAGLHPAERVNIRVIDCNSPVLEVIPVSREIEYAALSYVWGDPNPPDGYPQIVRDAIQATIAMGLQYLWVDAYCINQHDAADKQEQIAKMDVIYSHAALTLINAASNPLNRGLPGVSNIPRHQQLQETFNNVAFIQDFPNIATMVKASPWCSRGWTFQEGFFAPRRVIFTEYGASYLCHRMHCMEWKQQPLDRITAESLTPFQGIIPLAANRNTENYKLEIDWRSASDWVREYSKRKFTYSSDALNACRGILNYFRGSADPAYSIWGVPIPYVMEDSYTFDLGWRHEAPAKRNGDFPSWSFLGWHGAVTPEAIRVVSGSLYLGDYQEPFLEPKDVERLLGDRSTSREEDDDRLRYLHFKSKVIYLSLVHNDWTTEQLKHRTSVRYVTLEGIKTKYLDLIPAGSHASLRLAPNLYLLTNVYYDRETLSRSGNIGVKLSIDYSEDVQFSWYFFGIHLLILEDHGGLYERVGVTEFSLRGDSDTRVAFTNAAGDLLDRMDLTTILPFFLTEAEERTVVIS